MLGLLSPTRPSWVEVALAGLPTLLVDHAHCEMKAATNTLSLVSRWPTERDVATLLLDVADEELLHFRMVLAELDRRGLALGTPEPCDYAERLRKGVRASGGHAAAPLDVRVDRLLVAALIEARSCERMKQLADALDARGDALGGFYRGLLASEAAHYVRFVDLARRVAGGAHDVDARLAVVRQVEDEIARSLGHRPTLHG